MQIHELNNFAGTPTSTDYLAIDNSTTTTKIGATGLGIQTKMTVSEAETGTSTGSRIITPKVLHDYVDSVVPTVSTASDTWNGCDINYTKFGRVVTIRLTGSTTNQITSTNGGELTVKTIPAAYRPRIQYFERKWITATIEAQVIVTTAGEFKIAYSQNISGSSATGVNIPSSSSLRIEICYISAS